MSPSPPERLTTEIVPGRYHQAVSNLPPTPSVPPPWPPALPPPRRWQWPMFAFLIVALLVTLGVAIVGWFRPVPAKPPPAPTYSNQQVADAKTTVCTAYEQVRKAGDVAGARSGGTDPIAMLAVATSSRQVFDVGSRYLLTKLTELPATPPDLAAAVRKLASIYQQLAIDYLAEAPDSELDSLVRAGDEAHSTIEKLCK
jgi:hypothetical protein